MPSSAARRVTAAEARPEMIATWMPARCTRLMPEPSRTWKPLISSPSRGEVQAAIGQHAVDVQHQQPHAPRARDQSR